MVLCLCPNWSVCVCVWCHFSNSECRESSFLFNISCTQFPTSFFIHFGWELLLTLLLIYNPFQFPKQTQCWWWRRRWWWWECWEWLRSVGVQLSGGDLWSGNLLHARLSTIHSLACLSLSLPPPKAPDPTPNTAHKTIHRNIMSLTHNHTSKLYHPMPVTILTLLAVQWNYYFFFFFVFFFFFLLWFPFRLHIFFVHYSLPPVWQPHVSLYPWRYHAQIYQREKGLGHK